MSQHKPASLEQPRRRRRGCSSEAQARADGNQPRPGPLDLAADGLGGADTADSPQPISPHERTLVWPRGHQPSTPCPNDPHTNGRNRTMKHLLVLLLCLGALALPAVAAAGIAATTPDTTAVASPDGLNDGETFAPVVVVDPSEMWGSSVEAPAA